MYKSGLHSVLVKALEATAWTFSTKDEDNFRQVLCLALNEDIAAGNVQIPSTRSGEGDIQVFGRKIELKYAHHSKPVSINSFAEDFDLLLKGEIDFAILAVALDRTPDDAFVHQCVRMPKLKKNGATADFYKGSSYTQLYRQISLVLPAAYPHKLTDVAEKDGKGNRETVYLSFEQCTAIARSSFLEIGRSATGTDYQHIHVDVIGSVEDGSLHFLYKRAQAIELVDVANSGRTVEIPYDPTAIPIAEVRYVNVHAKHRTSSTPGGPGVIVEGPVPVFRI